MGGGFRRCRTFVNSWERAADFAGDYSYLFNFLEGGEEKLDGDGRHASPASWPTTTR